MESRTAEPRGHSMDKLLIYGGTFNPIHNGHLHLAQAFARITGASRVILVPAHIPPHKMAPSLASSEQRLEMCRLAVAGRPDWQVSDIEMQRPGPSYTADTLDAMAGLYPDTQLYFVTGEDMFLTLLQWRDPLRILRRAVICGAPRSPAGLPRMQAYARRLEQQGGRTLVRDVHYLPVSSTQLRAAADAGEPIYTLGPPTVARYIAKNSLYQEP